MFHLLQDLYQSLNLPAQRHAMLVHLPIMMSVLALACLIMLTLSRGQSSLWRRATLAVLILGLISVKLARTAGDAAADQLNLPLTEQAADLLELHEQMANGLFWYFLATACFTVITLIPRFWVRWPATALALAAGIVLMLRITLVAHAGGLLVYQHGVGVPTTDNNVPYQAPAPPVSLASPAPGK